MDTVKKEKNRRSLCNVSGILNRIAEATLRDGISNPEPVLAADALTQKDVSQFDKYNQYEALFKKLPPPDKNDPQDEIPSLPKKDLTAAAFSKFYATTDRLAKVDLEYLHNIGRFVSHKNRRNKICQRARGVVHSLIGDGLSLTELFENCKHGQGTTIGTLFGETTETCKWRSLTGTSDAIRLFQIYLRWDLSLLRLLCSHYYGPNFLELNYALGLSFERIIQNFVDDHVQQVESSRATTVPKNTKTDRMIAIEPTLNMFFQQGVMIWLYQRIKLVFSVDLPKQQRINGYLAYLGSLFPVLFGTLDFESASDSVLCELVRFLFPSSFYSILAVIRCSHIEIEGSLVELDMISTMGNATTFPIETIVFYAFMIAVISMEQDTTNSSLIDLQEYKDKVGIFGDDCILPQKYCAEFIDVITEVGFVVNDAKSFYGPECFRESCGQDFLQGRNVRAVYISSRPPKRRSDLESWLYKYHNLLLKKCISHYDKKWYENSKHLRELFYSLFQSYNIVPYVVPLDYPVDSGLYVFDYAHAADPALLRTSAKFPVFDPNKGGFTFNFKRFIYRDEAPVDEGIVYRRYMWGRRHNHVVQSIIQYGKSYIEVTKQEPRSNAMHFIQSQKDKTNREIALYLKDKKLSDSSITYKEKKDKSFPKGFSAFNEGRLRRSHEIRLDENEGEDLFESWKRVGGYVVAKGISFAFGT